MFRQYHLIHKEVPPRASPSRSSRISPLSFVWLSFISSLLLWRNLGHLVSVRRSVDCEPGKGFVKICRVKESNVWEHSRPQTLHLLDRARRLWGTLRKRSQNLAMLAPQRMLTAKPKWRLTWTQLLHREPSHLVRI